MIRFIDLQTGNIFDGSSPYIFWFDGEQSVNLFYTKSICFISHQKIHNIILEDNNIFNLLDHDKLQKSNQNYDLNDIKSFTLESYGIPHHNYFIHMIYLCASSKVAGEYICNCRIDDTSIQIGVDFYDEDESLYINLSNKGVEIPESIQKAIYPVNIHEDKKDNIVLNRKWKELLSNFFDIMANKGSYKSLYNSLKWFEYGDLVQLKNIWEITDNGISHYLDEDISNRYISVFDGLKKSAYIGLSLALNKLKLQNGEILLDSEKNPILEQIVAKWTNDELALKMCLVGNFYKTYFMPIHLDLLYSTIENIVFTNTIKSYTSPCIERQDFIYDIQDIYCNIEDGSKFNLSNVECYTGEDTLFGSSIGVQLDIPNVNEKDIELFTSKLFKDIGAIINISFDIPLLQDDIIKKETMNIFQVSQNDQKTYIDTKPIFNGKFDFNLLFTKVGEYKIKFQFDTACGSTYIKDIHFYITDSNIVDVKLYKVTNNRHGLNEDINDYIFGLFDNNQSVIQYIPTSILNPYLTDQDWEGICLNHMVIYNNEPTKSYIKKHYDVFSREVETKEQQKKTYYICISKDFGFKPKQSNLKSCGSIYRQDYIFIPKYHKLEEFASKYNYDINSYIIDDSITLCAIPTIPYGKKIKDCTWEFINVSNHTSIKISSPIREPFIIPTGKTTLSKGYYDIVFRYSFVDESNINEIRLNSAFIKK